jgi:hypothetical protein
MNERLKYPNTQRSSKLQTANTKAATSRRVLELALALQNVFIKDVHAPRGLHRQFMGVFSEGLPSGTHRFSNGLLVDAASPFFDDAFPGHSAGDLLQHVGHENARAPKCGLPVANLRISNDITANHFLSHSAAMNTPFSPTLQRSELPSWFIASADLNH